MNTLSQKDFYFKGKHAEMVRYLARERNDRDVDKVFDRFIDVFLIAPLIGLRFNKTSEEGDNSGSATIMTQQLIAESEKIDYIFNVVNLYDAQKTKNNENAINFVFRESGRIEVFLKYLYGGVEYLYEYFNEKVVYGTKEEIGQTIIDLMKNVNKEYFEDNDIKSTLL